MMLPMAVMMTERAHLASRLKHSEARYRLMADHARDLVVRLRADGGRSYVSQAARSLLGYSPEELAEPRRELFHAEDDPVIRATLAPLFASAGSASIQFRMRHREGHWVWLEALAVSVPAERGEGFDIVYSARDISARVAAEQALQAQARTDALTGLPNRREFNERLQRALQRARRSGLAVAVFALDLDHFKAINDTHGHAVGDEALRAFARRIRGPLRQSDHLARLGGEEFIVLLPGAPVSNALEIAERLRASVAEAPLVDVPRVAVTVSIGVAAFRPGDRGTDLLARADTAAYAAKRSGRDRVVLAEG
jgi:diguanylate cyclase (GGDEF)-like protein/PAS domain S-box-containing protein